MIHEPDFKERMNRDLEDREIAQELLWLLGNCTENELNQAFRYATVAFHPDHVRNTEDTNRRFMLTKCTYELLANNEPCEKLLEEVESRTVTKEDDRYRLENPWGHFLWWRDKFFCIFYQDEAVRRKIMHISDVWGIRCIPQRKEGKCLRSEYSSRYDFDRMAEGYDKWYETSRGALYDRLEKKAINRLLPQSSGENKLLEIGCGTGHWSAFFSNKGYHLTGVDISERMLVEANKKGIPNSHFQLADAHDLPFEEDSYDIVAAITTLEYVRRPELVISEMVRCARKQTGQLFVGVLNILSSKNRKKRLHQDSPYASANMLSPEWLRSLLSPYGRVDIVVCGFTFRWRLLWPYSGVYDSVARLVKSRTGPFIVARVRL